MTPDPANEPTEAIVGVLSEVKLSEVLPVSDAVCRSGAEGVARLPLLITTLLSATDSAESTPPMVCFTFIE